MAQHKIRESYLYPALVACATSLLGKYSNWNITVKRKDDSMDYNELYVEPKKTGGMFISAINIDQLERIVSEAHIFVAGYEWGYQQGKEDYETREG